VLLHGRGATEQDLLPLARYLPPGSMLVAPRAPFPAAAWGYGPGWAWYRFLGGTRPEPDSFDRSQEALEALLATLPDRLPARPGRLLLGGFSQGGTMSLAYAVRHPGAVPLVLNLSGFVADHPSVRIGPDTVRGTAFFWGHGSEDGNIPLTVAQAGRAALRAAGANLVAPTYPIGHTITMEELGDVREWLDRSLAEQ
jgi:phospholipase/carboxylesterase